MTVEVLPKIVAVIPSRMASSRFPGKPLASILGRPMIQHIWERTQRSKNVERVIIATCDEEIQRAAEAFGAQVIMTSARHKRATERVAEASEDLQSDIIVMVQGDEPLVKPEMIDQAIAPMLTDPDVVCVNLVRKIQTLEDYLNPNTIKVTFDLRMDALFMSRQPIPTASPDGLPVNAHKQVCIIPFRRNVLLKFAELPESPLERAESIDMLRFLEHRIPIRLVEIEDDIQSVDTPGDLECVERKMQIQVGSK